MFVFRLIAWLIMAIAVALLGADLVSTLETGELFLRSLSDILALLGVVGFDTMAEGLPAGASQAVGLLAGAYAWLVLGVIGLILVLIFRPMD